MVQRKKMTERNVIKVSGAPEENKGENKNNKNATETKVTKGHKNGTKVTENRMF